MAKILLWMRDYTWFAYVSPAFDASGGFA